LFCNLKKKGGKRNLSLLLVAVTHSTARFPCRSDLSPHFPSSPKSTVHPLIFPLLLPLTPALLTPFPQVPSQGYHPFPLTSPGVLPPPPGRLELVFHTNARLGQLRWTPPHCRSLDRGVIQKPGAPSINPRTLLCPDPFGQRQPKETIVTLRLEQAGFVPRAPSVIVGLF